MIPIDPDTMHGNWHSVMHDHWHDWCGADEKHLDNRNGFTYEPKSSQSTTLPSLEFEKTNASMHSADEIVNYWANKGWARAAVRKELNKKRKRVSGQIPVQIITKLPKQFMTYADFHDCIATKGKKGAKEFLRQTFNMTSATFKAQTRAKRRKVVTTKKRAPLEAHVKPVRDWIAENPAELCYSSENWNRMANDIEVAYKAFRGWAGTDHGHITKGIFRKMIEYVYGKVEHHFVEGAGAYSKNTKGNIPLQIGKQQTSLDDYWKSSSSSSSSSSNSSSSSSSPINL